MSVAILGAVLNAHAIGPRLPAAFAVLGVAVLIAISVSSLSLGRRRPDQADATPAATPAAPSRVPEPQ